MNCNLVTKLQIRCFNFLLYCRVADLFNQHSKYVCNSFHARRRKRQLRVCFSLLQHLLLFGSQKKTTFFLSTAIKPEIKAAAAAAAQVSSYSALLTWYLQRGAGGHDATMGARQPAGPWAWPGHKGHAELRGEQGQIYCTFRLQHTKCWMLPIGWHWGQNLRVEISSPRIPWAEEVVGQARGAARGGWRGLGLGLRAAPSQAVPFSRAVI